MKFTLLEIRALEKSLIKITLLELPIRISYRLAKLLRFCFDEISLLEKARIELVKKYGVSSDPKDETQFIVEAENKEKFKNEFELLLREEVEFPFESLSIEELGDINISAIDLMGLIKIIKDEKERGI